MRGKYIRLSKNPVSVASVAFIKALRATSCSGGLRYQYPFNGGLDAITTTLERLQNFEDRG